MLPVSKKMMASNLRWLFLCAILQMIAADSTEEDGKALFFGFPVSLKESETRPDSSLDALLKSTFLAQDTNEEKDPDPLYTIIQMDDGEENATEDVFADLPVNELPNQEGFFSNALETEATAPNSQRQPPRNLMSFVRSAMALTRPLAAPRPLTLSNLFSLPNGSPLSELVSLVETFVSSVGNTLRQSPIGIFGIIDNVQNANERMGQDGECGSILELVQQTATTRKEFTEMLGAVQKLGEMWNVVNIPTLGKCLTKTRTPAAEANQNPTTKVDSKEAVESV